MVQVNFYEALGLLGFYDVVGSGLRMFQVRAQCSCDSVFLGQHVSCSLGSRLGTLGNF